MATTVCITAKLWVYRPKADVHWVDELRSALDPPQYRDGKLLIDSLGSRKKRWCVSIVWCSRRTCPARRHVARAACRSARAPGMGYTRGRQSRRVPAGTGTKYLAEVQTDRHVVAARGPGVARMVKQTAVVRTHSGRSASISQAAIARHRRPAAESPEINHLLGLIENSGCEFFRNGTWYDAQRAAAHLRGKYQAPGRFYAGDGDGTGFHRQGRQQQQHDRPGLPHKVRRRRADDDAPVVQRSAVALSRGERCAALLARRAIRSLRKDSAHLHR